MICDRVCKTSVCLAALAALGFARFALVSLNFLVSLVKKYEDSVSISGRCVADEARSGQLTFSTESSVVL